MANVSVDGMDEAFRDLQRADLWTDDNLSELLDAAADEIKENVVSNIKSSRFRIAAFAKKVTKKSNAHPMRDKNGNPYTNITVSGKDGKGTSIGTILFVLNYGRQKKYGQITGDYFWTRGVQTSQKTIPGILQSIIDKKLERG